MKKLNFKKIWEKLRSKMPIFLIVYVLLFTGTVAMFTKYNSAPDEKMRLDLVYYVSDNLSLPHGGDEAVRDAEWGFSYAFEPMTPQILSGIIFRVARMFTHRSDLLLFAPRVVSVIFIAIYASFVLKISRKLFEKGIYRVLFVLMTALIPQVLYLGGYVNNDSMGLMTIAMTVYAWLIGIEKKWDYKTCLFLGFSLGLLTLSYYNAYGYLITSVILFIGVNIARKVKWMEILKKGLLISAVAFLIGGWWFIRSGILYNGDIFGLKSMREYGEQYAAEGVKPSERVSLEGNENGLFHMLWNRRWTESVRQSFYGNFGYRIYPMVYESYMLYELLSGIGLIGIFVYIVRKIYLKKTKKKEQIEELVMTEVKMEEGVKKVFVATMVISAIIPVVLAIYYSFCSDFQPQGRYIMPMAIPLMFFIISGVRFILKDLKEWKRNIILGFFVVVLIITPVIELFAKILPSLGY